MALHLISNMFICDGAAALMLEDGLGSLAAREKSGHALRTLRVKRSQLGWSLNLSDRVFGRLFAIEVRARQVRCVEPSLVVAWPVEKFSLSRIEILIVLGGLHTMMFVPGELSKDISMLVDFGVLGHTRALHLVCFIWVQSALDRKQNLVAIAEVLIKILFVVLGIV